MYLKIVMNNRIVEKAEQCRKMMLEKFEPVIRTISRRGQLRAQLFAACHVLASITTLMILIVLLVLV